jgi:hypothetical protein
MVSIALVFDIVEVILNFFGVSLAIDPTKDGLFFIWFGMYGISMITGKNLKRTLLMVVIGIIPILDALPETTFGVWYTIKASRKEDEETMKQQEGDSELAELENQGIRIAQTRMN